MTTLPHARLEEIVIGAQSGFASGIHDPNGVVQVRMNNVTREGNLIWDKIRRVPTSNKELNKYSLVPGDVMFNATNSPELVGKTALFGGFKEPVVFSNHFIRLRIDRTKVVPTYLARWLLVQWKNRIFENIATRWVNQAAVRRDDLLALQIPLPPLDEQKRIAAILKKADRLRRLRRYALELSDGFLQSVFLEMFGDPVTNPMGWERATAAELGMVQTGNTPSRKKNEYYGDYIEWIKSDNIVEGRIWLTRSKEMLSELGLSVGRVAEAGSILVTCIAGSVASIGNVALADRRVTFNQQINALTPNADMNPYFLYGLFLFAKPLVQRTATSSMKRIITKSKFENLQLFRPPTAKQNSFAEVLSRHEQILAKKFEALRQADHLFDTLLHRAFRGEL